VGLNKSPVLANPNFTKDFILFSFTLEHTISSVLLQKDELDFEKPIAYFSWTLRDALLRYYIMEKQVYSLVKDLKDFMTYILHSHVIAYVPNNLVNDVLTQLDPKGRRVKWIETMLQYNLEIKPIELIKGQGLVKLMAQLDCDALGMNFIADLLDCTQEEKTGQVSQEFIDSPWYAYIIYVLENIQAPPSVSKNKDIFLKLKEIKFSILDNSLYWKDPGGILLEDDVKRAIQEFQKGDCRGNHYWKNTGHKILRAGYYWPRIFADVYKEVSDYHKFHIFDGRRKL
jgi:hypothetical protein